MSRLRTNIITNRMANGAPTVSNGLVISGITTTSEVNVGQGATFSTVGNATFSGIVTATTFVGNLTGTASANAVLTGSTNNTLVTVTGANAITGESNLTFDGTTLGLTGNQTVSGTVQVAGNSNFGAAAASPSPSALTVKMATNKHIGFSPSQSEVGDVPALVAFQDNGSLNSIGFRGTDLRFAAGSAERVRIDSSGRLGIGANNNDSYDSNARNVLIASSGNTGVTIRSGGSSNYAMIHFADGTTGAAQQRAGRILYEHSTDSLQISTANTFAFKIDSNGYVTKPSHPSFCARFQSGDTFVSTNIFRLTLINNDNFSWNTGSHYSTTTGKFTAPVAGVYFFEAQAMTTGWSNGNDTQDMLELRTNNGLVTYGRQRRSYFRSEDDANGYYVNGTAGQVNLAAGDTVWFQKRAALSYGFGNVNYTYFTGWLIG